MGKEVFYSYSESKKVLNYIEYVQYSKGLIKYDLSQFYNYKVGDKIHLKSYSGVYEIVKKLYKSKEFKITCNKWKVEFESGIRKLSYDIVPFYDIKCHFKPKFSL